MNTLRFAAASLLLVSILPGQGIVADQAGRASLVGWVQNPANTRVCSQIHLQKLGANCPPANSRFLSLCNAFGTGAGGTAYEARLHSAWVSNGRDIALQNIDSGVLSCRFAARLSSRKDSAVTGLAMVDSKKLLVQLDMGDVGKDIHGMFLRFYDTSTCPPTPLKRDCSRKLQSTTEPGRAMGLAYDEARGLLYYSTSIQGFAGYSNALHVVKLSDPCTDVAVIHLPSCSDIPFHAITGLAYDACSQQLYASDGQTYRTLRLTYPTQGRYVDRGCCKHGSSDNWQGLAVVPGGHARQVGKSCLHQACGPCNNMELLTFGGDLALGNPHFGFALRGAPGNNLAFAVLSLGSCTSGVKLPGLCGPVHLNLNGPGLVALGPFLLGSSNQCGGAIRLHTPIPGDPGLCAAPLCMQWYILCPTNGPWTGLSNALDLRVGGG